MVDTNSQDMGNNFLIEQVEPMPWKGVTVSEQRQRFLKDDHLNYCSVTEFEIGLASQGRLP